MAEKRRPHGTGSISRRSDGRFVGLYYVRMPDGKKKRCAVYADTKAACNKLLLAAIKEEKQKREQPKRLLLKDYMTTWLEGRLDYRANSVEQRAESIRNHIIPMLGDKEISEITKDDVGAFVAAITKGRKPRTVRSIYETLSAALGAAVDDGLIETSPCTRIKLPPKDQVEHTILDVEQAYKLCTEINGHWLAPIVKLGIGTGMRKSELLALKWSDIDLTKGVIYVRHNVAYLPKIKFVPGPPKSKTSVRTISLTQFSLDVLKAHRVAQMATRDIWGKSDLVFPGDNGGYRTPRTLNYYLDKMIERASVPRITFHELRHSAASALIALGVNIKVIQELLGHSSIQITLDLYAHLLPKAQSEAMRHFSDAWERAKKDAEEQMDIKKDAREDGKGA